MKKHITIVLQATLFGTIIITSCMDTPNLQLQLTSQKRETDHFKGVLYINELNGSNNAFLMPKEIYTPFRHCSLPTPSYGEPFVFAIATKSHEDNNCLKILLPIRYLYGLKEGDVFKLTLPKHPDYSKEWAFELTCVKSPRLQINFKEQVSRLLKNFFECPTFFNCHAKEFAQEELLAVSEIGLAFFSTEKTEMCYTAGHGPKGIDSEEKFLQIIRRKTE
jgi:hypothetical protein